MYYFSIYCIWFKQKKRIYFGSSIELANFKITTHYNNIIWTMTPFFRSYDIYFVNSVRSLFLHFEICFCFTSYYLSSDLQQAIEIKNFGHLNEIRRRGKRRKIVFGWRFVLINGLLNCFSLVFLIEGYFICS